MVLVSAWAVGVLFWTFVVAEKLPPEAADRFKRINSLGLAVIVLAIMAWPVWMLLHAYFKSRRHGQ